MGAERNSCLPYGSRSRRCDSGRKENSARKVALPGIATSLSPLTVITVETAGWA